MVLLPKFGPKRINVTNARLGPIFADSGWRIWALEIGVGRNGLEVPKFVFMSVHFETHGHAQTISQLLTFSVTNLNAFKILKVQSQSI